MATGNESNHVMSGLTVQGSLSVSGANGYLQDVTGNKFEEELLNGHLPGVRTVRRNMTRNPGQLIANLAVAATGIMNSYAMVLYAGDVINYVSFYTATTAAVAPTNWWAAIYDDQPTPALLAQGADQTSTALPANTFTSTPLGYTITRTAIYRIGLMFATGTQPTLFQFASGSSAFSNKQLTFGPDKLWQTSGSALTTTAPSTITGGSVTANIPLLILSSAL